MGNKLMNIRNSLKLKHFQMADRLRTYRSSYYNYEIGKTNPQLLFLYLLGITDNISMDWLILDRGSMYYKESVQTSESPKEIVPSIAMERDVKELLDHMERSPLLRHEILLMFYKFKQNNKGIFADSKN